MHPDAAKFKQHMLNYLADNTSDPDLDVHAPYAKTYAKHPHNVGLRCFPATITQFDPCHKTMWSAAYYDAIQLTVVQKCTLSLQAHVHHMERSLYGAHAVASIAKHHARLINNKATITTLQLSAWNLWKAILTGASFRPLGCSLVHALALMARS